MSRTYEIRQKIVGNKKETKRNPLKITKLGQKLECRRNKLIQFKFR